MICGIELIKARKIVRALVLGHIIPCKRDNVLSNCITKLKTETKVAIVVPNPPVHFVYESIMLKIFVWLCKKYEHFNIVDESIQ